MKSMNDTSPQKEGQDSRNKNGSHEGQDSKRDRYIRVIRIIVFTILTASIVGYFFSIAKKRVSPKGLEGEKAPHFEQQPRTQPKETPPSVIKEQPQSQTKVVMPKSSLPSAQDQKIIPSASTKLYENNQNGFRFRYQPNFVLRELAKEEDGDPSVKAAYKIEPKILTPTTPVLNFNIFQVPFDTKVKEMDVRYKKEARQGSTWERVIVWNIVGAQQFTIRRDDGSGALYFLIPRRRGEETYSFELPQTTKNSLDQTLTLMTGIAKTFEFTMPSISEWPRVTARHLNQNATFSFQYPPDWLLDTSEGVEGPIGATHPFYELYVPGKPDAAVNVEMIVSLEPRNIELYSSWENQVRGITVGGYDPKSIKYETRTIVGKTTLYYTYLAHGTAPVHSFLFPSPDGKFIVRASLFVGKPEEADQFWSAFEDFINSIIVGG